MRRILLQASYLVSLVATIASLSAQPHQRITASSTSYGECLLTVRVVGRAEGKGSLRRSLVQFYRAYVSIGFLSG